MFENIKLSNLLKFWETISLLAEWSTGYTEAQGSPWSILALNKIYSHQKKKAERRQKRRGGIKNTNQQECFLISAHASVS